jgi:hypothetical protein
MIRSKLPPAILADMDKFTKSDGTRAAMDGHGTMRGYYGMELGVDYFEFHSAELAPPQGNYARNYARFTHHEKNAHDYVTVWTTNRREDAAAKGHFYLSSHSIKVESATDTLFVFRGELFHGTTLPDVHPAKLETDFKQISLGFATGRKLLTEGIQSLMEVNIRFRPSSAGANDECINSYLALLTTHFRPR